MSLTLALLALLVQGPADSAQVLDDFESLDRWSALPSEGVALSLRSDRGPTGEGRALRLDFDFQGHGGYAIARRVLDLALPENYEFSFWIRGDARPNTLEFKLADASGENVWWYTRPSYQFPHQWQKVTIKRRLIRFAWGPAGGGDLRRAATVELVVSAVATDETPGNYPRYFSDTQVYWTVLASGDGRRGLLNEDGALETGQGRFSIEPFLFAGGRLLT